MKRFLISTPDDLHRRLKQASLDSGQTLCGLIRNILWDWAKQNLLDSDTHQASGQ